MNKKLKMWGETKHGGGPRFFREGEHSNWGGKKLLLLFCEVFNGLLCVAFGGDVRVKKWRGRVNAERFLDV